MMTTYMRMASLFFNIPILLSYAHPFPYAQQYGEVCDWRGHNDPCDQSRGLACSYSTGTCSCWDTRRTYSSKRYRCVGKAGEECVFYESERLCTENSYCLEDRSLSPLPLCVCLKGYFRSDNGTCIKYSTQGQPCQPERSQQAKELRGYPSSRQEADCEPQSGLVCSPKDSTCQCEPGQFFNDIKGICTSKAGQKCSRSINNCIKNSECTDKMWGFDYETGETKIIGYRCGCKRGLKITDDGICAADYGGTCNKSSDCFSGENLSCLNGMCQCHPLSQIYDKRARRCFNLVGTRCHLPKNTETVIKNSLTSSITAITTTSTNMGTNSNRMPKMALNTSSNSSSTAEMATHKTSGDDNLTSISPTGTEEAPCISNSECTSTAQGPLCQCTNGSSETTMKTCLLNYGQTCRQGQDDLKCNVFNGLICQSDTNKCACADPSLVYDKEASACVSPLGSPCGTVKLEMLDSDEEYKSLMFVINCISNSSCLEKNINGKVKRLCVPNKGLNSGGSSLSSIMFNNPNVITDVK